MSMKGMIRGLSEFHTNYFCTHQEMFERLSQSQTPEMLFITCSDSRIDPNLLTQTQPGELFIIGEGAAIEYAVHTPCNRVLPSLNLTSTSTPVKVY